MIAVKFCHTNLVRQCRAYKTYFAASRFKLFDYTVVYASVSVILIVWNNGIIGVGIVDVNQLLTKLMEKGLIGPQSSTTTPVAPLAPESSNQDATKQAAASTQPEDQTRLQPASTAENQPVSEVRCRFQKAFTRNVHLFCLLFLAVCCLMWGLIRRLNVGIIQTPA